ncbi:MAG: 4'-phosphopantetheinyl transferase superfamily protein [Deltaproteobacteria bacterium]|nr:4'-phosphopantetheinyl transferase superfamily protein [Deltaproteobacteria bacterium]
MPTDFFPPQLSETLREIFASVPFSPAIIKMIGAEENITPAFLCPGEQTQLQSYKFPKRRSEFLSGRICAKLAASHYLQEHLHNLPEMEQIEICNSESGRPFLSLHPPRPFIPPEISISHSSGYAAAIAAQHRCGIDIQKQAKSLIKVKERYCGAREYALLTQIIKKEDELARLALLWAAKEAIQKTFSTKSGVVAFSGIRLQAGEEINGGCLVFSFSLPPGNKQYGQKNIRVAAVTFADYGVAVSISEKGTN